MPAALRLYTALSQMRMTSQPTPTQNPPLATVSTAQTTTKSGSATASRQKASTTATVVSCPRSPLIGVGVDVDWLPKLLSTRWEPDDRDESSALYPSGTLARRAYAAPRQWSIYKTSVALAPTITGGPFAQNAQPTG
jgi:hypothetical protein